MLDKICALQSKLDSQTRISEGLQRQLQMRNQALAQEERQRKYLEIQLSESETCFENVFSECQDAKSKIEHLSIQRDKEIATLRNSLSTKETTYKEADFRARKLEQENQDLLISLKELQEERIRGAGASSSLAKLRNKLKSLEHMHRDCSENLRAKEAQWSSQLEKLTGDLSDYGSKVESKDAVIKELSMELEGCYSSLVQLKLQSEEASLMVLVLKLGLSEAQLKLASEKDEMALQNKEREENISHLMNKLEMKSAALVKAQADIEEECEKVAALLRRVELLELIEQQQVLMQKELERSFCVIRTHSSHLDLLSCWHHQCTRPFAWPP